MAKTYDKQIEEAASLDEINEVISKIGKSTVLDDAKKETLLIEAQTKKNSIENQIRESKGTIPEDPIESEENKKPLVPVSHGEPPTKKVEVTVDELKEKEKGEWNGRLYGWSPLPKEKGKPQRGIAQVLLCLLAGLLIVSNAFAVKEATLGRQGDDDNYRGEVQSGDLLPGTTKTYDIGSSSNQVDSVFTEDVTIEDFVKMT